MAPSPELVHLPPGISVWQGYDPAVKAELFSTAISTSDGVYLVDPIPLSENALAQLKGDLRGVIVTNENHWRSVNDFARRFSIPIFARPEAFAGVEGVNPVGTGEKIGADLSVIGIEGAAAGELALFHSPSGGTLILGDALINFEPYGFTFLPAKYCRDRDEMQRSLRKLLDYDFKRMLFAHGTPILSGASQHLRELLNSHS